MPSRVNTMSVCLSWVGGFVGRLALAVLYWEVSGLSLSARYCRLGIRNFKWVKVTALNTKEINSR